MVRPPRSGHQGLKLHPLPCSGWDLHTGPLCGMLQDKSPVASCLSPSAKGDCYSWEGRSGAPAIDWELAADVEARPLYDDYREERRPWWQSRPLDVVAKVEMSQR